MKLRAAKDELQRREIESKAAMDEINASSDDHNNNSLCCICCDQPKSVLLLPCRHLCVCEGCAEMKSNSDSNSARIANNSLRKCPVCRTLIENRMKIFA